MTNKELQMDVSADKARALHRIVRAMHDGHCPKCGHLDDANKFVIDSKCEARHQCPFCEFTVSEFEATEALKAFQPYLDKSVVIFEAWRSDLKQRA